MCGTSLETAAARGLLRYIARLLYVGSNVVLSRAARIYDESVAVLLSEFCRFTFTSIQKDCADISTFLFAIEFVLPEIERFISI